MERVSVDFDDRPHRFRGVWSPLLGEGRIGSDEQGKSEEQQAVQKNEKNETRKEQAGETGIGTGQANWIGREGKAGACIMVACFPGRQMEVAWHGRKQESRSLDRASRLDADWRPENGD